MLRFSLLLLLLSCFVSGLVAQTTYPYLGENGLYGLADENGKVVLEPAYDWLHHARLQYPHQEQLQAYLPEKDGRFGLATLEGKLISEPVHRRVPNLVQLQLTDETNTNTDTLLSVIWDNYVALINHTRKTHSPQAYLSGSPAMQGKQLEPNRYESANQSFHHNITRVVRDTGRVNFFHAEGRELLAEDVRDGYVLSPSRLAILGDNGLLALCDTNGRALTPFIFPQLYASADPAFFLINTDHYNRENISVLSRGVVDENGQLVVDTIYQNLLTWNNEGLLAQKGDRWGVISYRGETILPFDFAHLAPAGEDRLIGQFPGSPYFALLDENGEALSDTSSYRRLVKIRGADYLEGLNDKSQRGIIDLSGKELFIDNFQAIFHQESPPGFRVRQRGPQGDQWGFYDREGNTLIPANFKQLEFPLDGRFIRVQQGEQFGLYDSLGKVFFEPIYDALEYDRHRECFWLLPAGELLYQAYDADGQRITDLPDRLDHRNHLPYKMTNKDGQSVILLKNGQYLPFDRSKLNTSFQTEAGQQIFIMQEGEDTYYAYNDLMENITPEGFRMARESNRQAVQESGLMVVQDDSRYGVIDAFGNWVIHPTLHRYYIVAPTLILQLTHPDLIGSVEPAIRIFTRQADGSFTPGEKEYQDANDELRDGLLRVGVAGSNQKPYQRRLHYGYVDSLGREVVAPRFEKLPRRPEPFMHTYITDSEGQRHNYIIDRSTNIRFEKVPYNEVYPAYQRDNLLMVKREDNRMGLIDSLSGEVLFPFTYQRLTWIGEGKDRLVFYDGETQESGLVDLDGREICRVPGSLFPSECCLPGTVILKDSRSLVIINPEDDVFGPYELRSVNFKTMTPHIILCRRMDGNRVYVNTRNGMIYQAGE